MSDPDDLDKDTARSSWLCTVKIFIPNLINHDDADAEPDPATVAMGLIEEDNGFAGFCDWPEHYQIQNFVPYSKAAWQDAVKTRKARDAVTLRVFIQHMKERLGECSPVREPETDGVGHFDAIDVWQMMEDVYAQMTSTP